MEQVERAELPPERAEGCTVREEVEEGLKDGVVEAGEEGEVGKGGGGEGEGGLEGGERAGVEDEVEVGQRAG